MTIALTVLLLTAIAACFLVVAALQRHGLAGCLYLMASALHAAGDAVKAAQQQHRASWPEYRRRALEEALR